MRYLIRESNARFRLSTLYWITCSRDPISDTHTDYVNLNRLRRRIKPGFKNQARLDFSLVKLETVALQHYIAHFRIRRLRNTKLLSYNLREKNLFHYVIYFRLTDFAWFHMSCKIWPLTRERSRRNHFSGLRENDQKLVNFGTPAFSDHTRASRNSRSTEKKIHTLRYIVSSHTVHHSNHIITYKLLIVRLNITLFSRSRHM